MTDQQLAQDMRREVKGLCLCGGPIPDHVVLAEANVRAAFGDIAVQLCDPCWDAHVVATAGPRIAGI